MIQTTEQHVLLKLDTAKQRQLLADQRVWRITSLDHHVIVTMARSTKQFWWWGSEPL